MQKVYHIKVKKTNFGRAGVQAEVCRSIASAAKSILNKEA
jgi:hypothetical protein